MPNTRTACAFLPLLLLPLAAGRAQNRPHPPDAKTLTKTLTVGESDVYEFDHMTAAAVGSPTVADIVPLSSRRLLVNAKSAGETTLFVYDRRGRHSLRLAVVLPAPDLGPVAARVQAEIGLPGVTVRAVRDTLFLEGGVTSVVALQRASAIAGVYTARTRNLLTILPAPESAPAVTLAQTYAALLTDSLAGTGVRVQIVDDKTIALLGQYASHVASPAPSSGASAPRARKARKPKRTSQGGDGADEAASDESAPLMDLKEATPKRVGDGTPRDPLDRLIESLPPDLKVVDLVNLGSRPTRQILVHAKIIEVARTVSAKTPPPSPPPIRRPSPARPRPLPSGPLPAGSPSPGPWSPGPWSGGESGSAPGRKTMSAPSGRQTTRSIRVPMSARLSAPLTASLVSTRCASASALRMRPRTSACGGAGRACSGAFFRPVWGFRPAWRPRRSRARAACRSFSPARSAAISAKAGA